MNSHKSLINAFDRSCIPAADRADDADRGFVLVEVLIEHLRRQAITSANRAQAIQITTITDLKVF